MGAMETSLDVWCCIYSQFRAVGEYCYIAYICLLSLSFYLLIIFLHVLVANKVNNRELLYGFLTP